MKWYYWFQEPQFYLIGVLYMASRLTFNTSQVYIVSRKYTCLVVVEPANARAVHANFWNAINIVLGQQAIFFSI